MTTVPVNVSDAASAAPRRSYSTPFQPLSASSNTALEAKISQRTATRDEYQQVQWSRRFDNRRSRGVQRFWSAERKRLLAGQDGSRSWTAEQQSRIIKRLTPQFNDQPIEGHHRYNALNYPDIADNPSYIYPATDLEHLYRWHGGNYQNETHGAPLNPLFDEEF